LAAGLTFLILVALDELAPNPAGWWLIPLGNAGLSFIGSGTAGFLRRDDFGFRVLYAIASGVGGLMLYAVLTTVGGELLF
jgi:hypothetical protein